MAILLLTTHTFVWVSSLITGTAGVAIDMIFVPTHTFHITVVIFNPCRVRKIG